MSQRASSFLGPEHIKSRTTAQSHVGLSSPNLTTVPRKELDVPRGRPGSSFCSQETLTKAGLQEWPRLRVKPLASVPRKHEAPSQSAPPAPAGVALPTPWN